MSPATIIGLSSKAEADGQSTETKLKTLNHKPKF